MNTWCFLKLDLLFFFHNVHQLSLGKVLQKKGSNFIQFGFEKSMMYEKIETCNNKHNKGDN